MGPERLDRARTVESIAAVTALGKSPWEGAVLVRYPPRAVGLAAGAAVGLLGAPAGGHGELLFPAVDSAGRSVGVGWRNRPCVGRYWDCASGRACRSVGSPACASRIKLVERGVDPAAGKHSRHRGRDLELAASSRGSVRAPGDAAEPPRRPSASRHDRRTCNQPDSGSRLPRSPT